ncbi:MAG: glycosyltransferase family 39 protein, partial [Candidatus Hydrogenedentes bacterium]|nr:glycosyltransferase family 39 protein [Candidatus Hydrogenedentota bacterium]
LGRRLAGLYTRTMIWYLGGVLLLWLLGLEGIYGHPTPFYAAYAPAFQTLAVPLLLGVLVLGLIWWTQAAPLPGPRTLLLAVCAAAALAALVVLYDQKHLDAGAGAVAGKALLSLFAQLPGVAVALAGWAALNRLLRDRDWFSWEPSPRERRWFLAGVFLFLVSISMALAMMRGGLGGISQAYARDTYEYVGDIGKTSSIRSLFTRYVEIHDFLSMHAKVHPPGPIALLWFISYFVGRTALALSVATVLLGSLAVFPLYFWARGRFGEPAARTACLLYALVPSIVLFTATSADILFTPLTLATLWIFDRALERSSSRDAVLAGLLYGLLTILSFSLAGIGVYFALVGVWYCLLRRWKAVIKTAVIMFSSLAVFHLLLYAWSGYDSLETFHLAMKQFKLDQHHLDLVTPRLAAWTYRFWNPLAWFFFAGIPVSLLFLWRLWRPEASIRALVVIFLLTLAAFDCLYFARGEGERSALYIFPFLVLPAAHGLDACGRVARSTTPLMTTLGFLAFQCWLVEAYFYTYW